MAQRFTPPEGEIVEVRVGYVMVRSAKGEEADKLLVPNWELVLPEIEYREMAALV